MTTRDDFLRLQSYGFQEAADIYGQPIRPSMQRAMIVLNELGQEILPILRANAPIGMTRRLRTSSIYRVYQDNSGGEPVAVLAFAQGATNPVSGFVYSRAVRTGRRPGKMPPYRQLQRWVQLKWGVPERLSASKAYLLAKHIARVGTRPNPYFERTLEQAEPLMELASRRLAQQIILDINYRITVLVKKQPPIPGLQFG